MRKTQGPKRIMAFPPRSNGTEKAADDKYSLFTVPAGKTVSKFALDADQVEIEPVDVPDQPEVPRLHPDLERVLFSPGVHFLKDPRTNVYNFSKHFEHIMSIKDFDFDKLPAYVPSGKDSQLARLASKHHKTYTGSTSSLTGLLTHLHFMLSHQRLPHLMGLSKFFPRDKTSFTMSQKAPASVFLRYDKAQNVYKVDSNQAKDVEIIVKLFGHELEVMLTSSEDEFETFRKNSGLPSPSASHTYHYTAIGNMLMRSQLDCKDSRLPGTGVFDLKTRAVCAIRHDLDYAQIHDGSNYHITKLDGEYESYSREWHDLIRSSLFKYSLQARIGRMDGIFLAYHSTRKMFGFQYVPLADMDKVFHTSHLIPTKRTKNGVQKSNEKSNETETDTGPSAFEDEEDVLLDDRMTECASVIADKEFKISSTLLSKIFDTIRQIGDSRLAERADFKKLLDKNSENEQEPPSYSIMLYCNGPASLIVFAKPMSDSHIDSLQKNPSEHLNSHANSLKEPYSYGADPFCLTQRTGRSLRDQEIPDLIGLHVTCKQTINGEVVPIDEHPAVLDPQDEWKVDVTISEFSKQMARDKYQKITRQMFFMDKYKTTARTERLTEEEEEAYRIEKLLELDEPNKLQRLLRRLSAKYDKVGDE